MKEADRIDVNNLYQAINDITNILKDLIELVDKALPLEVKED
jgi:hypothetical protein